MVIVVGVTTVIAALLVTAWRGELRPRRIEPGDYEAELIALCRGSRRQANRLIRAEMNDNPDCRERAPRFRARKQTVVTPLA